METLVNRPQASVVHPELVSCCGYYDTVVRSLRSLPLKASIERVPGGWMLLPLFGGALIVTAFPNIGPFFGSFTGALFSGALPILAVFYVCMGALIDVRALPKIA